MRKLDMRSHDSRMEAALYWSAISLMVCEGLRVDQAAKRLGIADHWLREILQKRQTGAPWDEPLTGRTPYPPAMH